MEGKHNSEGEKLDGDAKFSGEFENESSSKESNDTTAREKYRRTTRPSLWQKIFGPHTEETVSGHRNVSSKSSSRESSRFKIRVIIVVAVVVTGGGVYKLFSTHDDESRSRTLIVKWRAENSKEEGKPVLLDPINPSVKNVRNDAPITKSIDRNRLRFEYPKDSDEVRLEFTFQDYQYSSAIKIPKQDRATVMLEDGKVIVSEGE